MIRGRQATLAFAIGLAAASAGAAPMGENVEAVRVLSFDTDAELEVVSKTMTNVLRQRVVDGTEFALDSTSAPLVATAYDAKCALKGLKRPTVQANELAFDDACLKRIGARIGVKRFFWGLIYVEGSSTLVRLHFWQDGKGDRAATLPYDAAQRDRVADRLYRKLVTPNAVGDLKIVGGPAGEFVVDGKPAGAYVSGTELTLETGEHFLEVRDGPRVLARGRTRIEPGGRSEATMMPVAEPPPAPTASAQPYHDPPPIVVRPKASAWPWVLGGVGVAGLAGAGVFWGLRSSERADLKRACFEGDCLETERGAIKRADRYGMLSAFSLGVGVAAGAGLAAYLLASRRAPAPVSGAVVPLAGGAAVGVVGSF